MQFAARSGSFSGHRGGREGREDVAGECCTRYVAAVGGNLAVHRRIRWQWTAKEPIQPKNSSKLGGAGRRDHHKETMQNDGGTSLRGFAPLWGSFRRVHRRFAGRWTPWEANPTPTDFEIWRGGRRQSSPRKGPQQQKILPSAGGDCLWGRGGSIAAPPERRWAFGPALF